MSSGLTTDNVTVLGNLTLGEFTVAAGDLDGNGVLTLGAGKHGATMIVDGGVSLRGIKVVDSDGVTDITTGCGGMTIFIATDDTPYPATFTVMHDDAAPAAEHRFDCPSASGGARANVVIGRLQTAIRYSGALSRWICPGWSA